MPWHKWWHQDWLSDVALRGASLTTRGAWIDALSYMMARGCSSMAEDLPGWARLWGCLEATAGDVITELDSRRICDVSRSVTQTNGTLVTLTSRRLAREEKARNQAADRQARKRSRGSHTAEQRDCHGVEARGLEAKRPDEETTNTPPLPPQGGLGDTPKADTTKAPPKRRKRKASGNTDIKTFLDWWFQAFKNKTGSPYSITGKDASIAKRLLGTYALAALQEYAGRFFCNPGEFAQTAGLTLGVFASHRLRHLLLHVRAEEGVPPRRQVLSPKGARAQMHSSAWANNLPREGLPGGALLAEGVKDFSELS